jgi:hypothetical protein
LQMSVWVWVTQGRSAMLLVVSHLSTPSFRWPLCTLCTLATLTLYNIKLYNCTSFFGRLQIWKMTPVHYGASQYYVQFEGENPPPKNWKTGNWTRHRILISNNIIKRKLNENCLSLGGGKGVEFGVYSWMGPWCLRGLRIQRKVPCMSRLEQA